jgi:hypothetical protein
MRTKLRIRCRTCGHWNKVEVEKAFLNPDNPEPKVEVFIPSYLSTKTQKCKKCSTVLCEPNELFRIINDEAIRYRMRNPIK